MNPKKKSLEQLMGPGCVGKPSVREEIAKVRAEVADLRRDFTRLVQLLEKVKR